MNSSKRLSVLKLMMTVLIFGIIIIPTNMMAWETPVTIGGASGNKCEKPEIKFGPSGTVYMTFREKKSGGNSDITLCIYDGKEYKYENVSKLIEIWSSHEAYESAIVVDQNETIHVAWIGIDLSGDHETNHIMYRYKDQNGWSDVFDLGTIHHDEGLFDTRLGIDSFGNAHIMTSKHGDADPSSFYVAKFGDDITPIERMVGGKRLKHPDIAVNDDYVYILYMQKFDRTYCQMLQKRENKLGGEVIYTKQVTFSEYPQASQKGRIEFGRDGSLHMLDFYKGTPTDEKPKMLFYYEVDQEEGVLKNETLVSQPGKTLLYHWAGLSVRDNSIIATMQLGSASGGGQGLFYNWKRDGEWGGYTYLPGTSRAQHQSVDLSDDGKIAAVVWKTPDNKVHFISSEPITATGQLEAEFSFSNVFYGSDASFDASASISLNPDYTITKYIWDFNGVILETADPTITYKFEDGINFRTNIKVSLKIETENGEETGLIEKDVYLNANYNAININMEMMQIRSLIYNRAAIKVSWEQNPKNEGISVQKYQIWRALNSDFLSFQMVGEVDSNIFEFIDYTDIDSTKNYLYIIATVDSEGHISPVVTNNQ